MVDMAYECECGTQYSKGIYRACIQWRRKKFEKCECGRELRVENNKIKKEDK